MIAPGAGRLIGPVVATLTVLAGLWLAGFLPSSVPVEGLIAALVGLLIFLVVFFRDPERLAGPGIVSPADGRIRGVEREGDRWRISVFMNVTDVHVNRVPLDGDFVSIETAGAGHRAAYRPDAPANVRRHYRLRTALGEIEIVQITGVLARRLVSFVRPGETARKGSRFGMIVLGSRVDLLLPCDRTRPVVRIGERVWAGRSTLAEET